MKQVKMYKTITTYPSGETLKRNFTLEAFKDLCKCIGYEEEPFAKGLYLAETSDGINILEIKSIELIYLEW